MSLHVVPRSGTCLALNKSCWDRHHRSQDDYHQNQHNPHHHAILIIISVMTFTFFNKLLERSSYNSLPFLPLAPLHLPAISMIIVVGMRIIVMIILGGDKFTQKYCLWRKIPIWSTRSQGASLWLTSSWRPIIGNALTFACISLPLVWPTTMQRLFKDLLHLWSKLGNWSKLSLSPRIGPNVS